MTAWKRPEYTKLVLDALAKAWRPGWRFFGSLDEATKNPEVAEAMMSFARKHDGIVSVHTENIGCDANTFEAVELAFRFGGSDFNLHLEDDTVPSPDALDLGGWFGGGGNAGGSGGGSAFLLLHSDSRGGESPFALREIMRFNSWGWGVSRAHWELFRREWNTKKNHPRGWDWSMNLSVQRHALIGLQPFLSRVKNIGRNDGTYETPENHDAWTRGLVQARAESTAEFEIVERLAPGYAQAVEPWVLEAETK